MSANTTTLSRKDLLNKVPQVTVFFWIIKVLCTTVGETAADFLNTKLNFGLTGTAIVTGVLLAVALGLQFSARCYVPWRYWVTVTLISVFGTLVTDLMTDKLKVRLETSTIVFTLALGVTFAAWYATDRTLSIHSIRTRRRETFYWVAVLVSFALGTATGDLMAERLGYGYATTGLFIAALIAVTAGLAKVGLDGVLAFWLAYIFTRPLGASLGDYLSQPRTAGGLGLGTTTTSAIFLTGIVAVIVFLTRTKVDTREPATVHATPTSRPLAALRPLVQTVGAVGFLTIGGFVGYHSRTSSLNDAAAALGKPVTTTVTAKPAAGAATTVKPATAGTGSQAATSTTAPTAARSTGKLGDLATFRTITQDTLDKLNSGDQAGATKRVDDLEREWDTAQPKLQPVDSKTWTIIDGKVDTVLKQLRAGKPDPVTEKSALTALLQVLG